MVVIHQKLITFFFPTKCFEKYESQVVSFTFTASEQRPCIWKGLWETVDFHIRLIVVKKKKS